MLILSAVEIRSRMERRCLGTLAAGLGPKAFIVFFGCSLTTILLTSWLLSGRGAARVALVVSSENALVQENLRMNVAERVNHNARPQTNANQRKRTETETGEKGAANEEKLVTNNTTTQTANWERATKVILVTYMRSGSTFVGELLHQNPGVAYWFEPDMGLYSALYYTVEEIFPIDISHYSYGKRALPSEERNFLSENLLALLTCRYERVAVDTLCEKRGLGDLKALQDPRYRKCLTMGMQEEKIDAPSISAALRRCHSLVGTPCVAADFPHCSDVIQAIAQNDSQVLAHLQRNNTRYSIAQFGQRFRCLARLERVAHRCLPIAREMCTRRPVRVAKVIRLSMETIETILRRDPGVKVIHLLRDPRAIVLSRIKLHFLSRTKRSGTDPKVVEARFLCEKMANDIKIRKQLQQTWTNNFLEVQYEKVAEKPYEHYRQIYDFLGIKESPIVSNWIKSSTQGSPASRQRSNPFGTQRANSTKTAHQWKDNIDSKTSQLLTQVCGGIIDYLNT